MNRTQIYLPDELHARAKKIAKKHNVSLAELSRQGLESRIAELERQLHRRSLLEYLSKYPEQQKISMTTSAVELARSERAE